MPPIDDTSLLENFGKAGDRVVGRIEYGSVLLDRVAPEMMIETCVGGTHMSEVTPTCRVKTAAVVDSPNDRAYIKVPNVWIECFEMR